MRAFRRASRGVTIVEVLITIAVIGVLVSILAVAIGRVRETSRAIDDLQRLRSIHTQFREWGT